MGYIQPQVDWLILRAAPWAREGGWLGPAFRGTGKGEILKGRRGGPNRKETRKTRGTVAVDRRPAAVHFLWVFVT